MSLTSRTESWRAPVAAVAIALTVSACGYVMVPVRDVVSPADVSTCRRLGEVGFTRTDGTSTWLPGAYYGSVRVLGRPDQPATPITRDEIAGPNFGVTLRDMREAAYALGATDLLLTRRIYRDWSYVAGTAYRCRN